VAGLRAAAVAGAVTAAELLLQLRVRLREVFSGGELLGEPGGAISAGGRLTFDRQQRRAVEACASTFAIIAASWPSGAGVFVGVDGAPVFIATVIKFS
jgi:hypothetical protein